MLSNNGLCQCGVRRVCYYFSYSSIIQTGFKFYSYTFSSSSHLFLCALARNECKVFTFDNSTLSVVRDKEHTRSQNWTLKFWNWWSGVGVHCGMLEILTFCYQLILLVNQTFAKLSLCVCVCVCVCVFLTSKQNTAVSKHGCKQLNMPLVTLE